MNYSDETELKNWLALARLRPTAKRQQLILQQFPTLADFFSSSSQQRQQLDLPLELVVDLDGVNKDLTWLNSSPQHHIITLYNSEYPASLKQIPDPPPLLFVQGNVALLQTSQLAIVGSRNPTPDGNELASQFSQQLAALGLTITSGLAMGIDAAAHQGALAVSGGTIAVVGTSLETVYPKRNEALAQAILAKGGALVSEFPIGTPPCAKHFPQRNRIISGLSLGVLVVEATLKSGSLITARWANEQGRDVFAIPSSIHNPQAQGCHALIKQGAKLVENIGDIVVELAPSFKATVPSLFTLQANGAEANSKQHQQLLDYMGFATVTPDQLVARSGIALPDLMNALVLLQLQGLITTTSNGYIRVRV